MECFEKACVVRRSEKLKKLKLILFIVRKLVYIYTKQGYGLKRSTLGYFLNEEMADKMALTPL